MIRTWRKACKYANLLVGFPPRTGTTYITTNRKSTHMTTNNTVSTTSTVISSEVAERIEDTFNGVVHIASAVLGVDIPKDASDADKWEKACVALLNAHKRFRKAKREEQVRAFRQGCEDLLAVARGQQKKAKEEYDALSPNLKALMPKFPTSVSIPVSDFSDIFPEGTTKERIQVLLKDMSYKLVKTANGVCVSVPLFPESKEEKDAKVGIVRRKSEDAAA